MEKMITVLIPVFNEADGLAPLLGRVKPILEACGYDWQILFVDDGSRDGTLEEIRRAHAADPRILALSFSRNFGKEIAIAAGLAEARGDAVIIMDADLQHPPELINEFLAKWQEGYENIYGERQDRATDAPLRSLFSRAFYRIYNALVDTDIPKGAGDFRLLDRRAVDAMNAIGEVSRFNKGLFSWIGFKAVGVPYTVAERAIGTTRWSFRRLASFAIDGLTSFTTLPLRVWSLIGAAISCIAIVYAMVFLLRTLVFGADIPGFPSLIISVMLFAGIQLISLGVIGEYLGRVYEEVKSRPLYIVADRVGLDPDAETGGAPFTAGWQRAVSSRLPGDRQPSPGNGAR